MKKWEKSTRHRKCTIRKKYQHTSSDEKGVKGMNTEEMKGCCQGTFKKGKWEERHRGITKKESIKGKLDWKGPTGIGVQQNARVNSVK